MALKINKVLVPIDHSESSLEAAWMGLVIASSFGASLTLLHVQSHSTVELFHVNYSEFQKPNHEEFHDSVLKYVDDPYSQSLCSAVNKGMVEIEIDNCQNKPAVVICKYAQSNGVDLIVMGSRGLSNMEGIVLGSVSSEVVHHAPCAVTIVR